MLGALMLAGCRLMSDGQTHAQALLSRAAQKQLLQTLRDSRIAHARDVAEWQPNDRAGARLRQRSLDLRGDLPMGIGCPIG